MSTAAAIAIVVGTAFSIDASKKSARASKERGKVVSAAQQNEDAAALRNQARQARIKRAKIAQTSENTGSGGSSRELGSISSLTTQVNANQARLSGQQNTAGAITGLNEDIADAQVQGAIGSSISSLGSSAFSATGGFDNLFKGS